MAESRLIDGWPAGAGEMAARIRAHDWGTTPLGPAVGWPLSLRTAVEVLLAHPAPTAVLWGDDLVLLYNDGYRDVMGPGHPAGLGSPVRGAWSAIWAESETLFARARAGERVALPDGRSMSPLGDGGEVAGLLVTGPAAGSGRPRGRDALRASEARYRELVEALDEGFGVCEVSGPDDAVEVRWLEVNARFRVLTGLSTGGPGAGDLARDVWPGLHASWSRVFAQVARTGQAIRFQQIAPYLDRSLDACAFPIGTPGERQIGVLLTDITARTRAEAAQHRSEERLREATAIDTVGILFYRLDGRIIDANPAFERMTGYSLEELRAAAHWHVLTPPEFGELTMRAAEDLAVRGEAAPYEKQLVRKDGSRWWGLFAPRRLRGRGRDAECIEFAIDIGTSKRHEEALRASREALRASEARYRDLFTSIDQGFGVLEVRLDGDEPPDLRMIEANPRLLAMFGLSSEPPRPGVLRQLTPAIDRAWIERYEQVALTSAPLRFEECSDALGGRWFDVYAFPTGDAGSHQVATLIEDISDRKRTERAMEADLRGTRVLLELGARLVSEPEVLHEEILSAAIELSRAAGGSLQIVEPEAAALVLRAWRGLTPALEGSLRTIDAGPDAPALVALVERDRWFVVHDASGAPSDRLLVEAGYRSSQSTPLLSRDGAPLGLLTTHWRDVHRVEERELRFLDLLVRQAADAIEVHRATQALRDAVEVATAARREAEAANRAKDDFLTVLSHELRTPLGPILLWGRMLRSGQVPAEEVDRAIDAIVASAESQSRLVEDLLDLSRSRSGRLSLAPELTGVAEVIRAAAEVVRPAAEAKQLRLTIELDAGLGATMLDPRRFQQILWNLLSNAVKFTPERGRVSLRAWSEADEIVIEVADDGLGMTDEFLTHAFERFHQADMRDDRSHGGLGIGLALCRELVQLLGGTIEARSDGLGRGSTFTVRIARRLRSDPAPVELGGPGAASAQAAPEPPSLGDVRVLVVEDDDRTREAMGWALARVGADVHAVASAGEALGVLEAEPPGENGHAVRVIVCDLGLPGMNGYELIERIARLCEGRGHAMVPACAVSAHVRPEDRRRAIEAGFAMYLPKPVGAEVLIEAVRDLADVARDVH